MRKKITLINLLFTYCTFCLAQDGAPASPYYDGFNWNQSGLTLKNNLATLITDSHTNLLSYSQVWNATQVTDLDPEDPTQSMVLLLYGFSSNTCPSSTTDDKDHRTRDKNANGGSNSCEWNREHVYAKALGTPALDDGGISDAGEDAHHLRACDVDRNGDRSNEKFANGSGNSGDITSTTWYPGDEWKGDIARMVMYMYVRYGNQCLPSNVGVGSSASTPDDMIDLFLQWNAEDPVSEYEDNRNTYHGNTTNTYAQGNRNPFIDNPYLATLIWGGPTAENRWPSIYLSTEDFDISNYIKVYPIPSNNLINIESSINFDKINVYNFQGKLLREISGENNYIEIDYLAKGFYFIEIIKGRNKLRKKIIIN